MKSFFEEIFAVTAPGLEQVCAREIRALLDCRTEIEKGGVLFSGSREDLYRVNLHSRIASRFLVRIGEIRATDFPELYRKSKKLPWGRFIRPETPVVVRVSSRRSRLHHTGRIEEAVSDAVDGALGRRSLTSTPEAQLVIARFERDRCELSVDSSGELLHRRGYRIEVSRASLRENLAAGILALLDWDGREPLCDPMCGSGTFLLEGGLLAVNIPPGLSRSFAFQSWPKYRSGLWENLLFEAERDFASPEVQIFGSDSNAEIVAAARRNAVRAGLDALVRFEHLDVNSIDLSEPAGLMICNPPYGKRIGEITELEDLYRRIGKVFSERFNGWRFALFCPSEDLVRHTGLNFRAEATVSNGGLPTRLFVFDP